MENRLTTTTGGDQSLHISTSPHVERAVALAKLLVFNVHQLVVKALCHRVKETLLCDFVQKKMLKIKYGVLRVLQTVKRIVLCGLVDLWTN